MSKTCMSNINMINDHVPNTARKTSAANDYYLVYVYTPDGDIKPALFTEHDIGLALERADDNNQEDVYPLSFIVRLLNWIKG